MGRHRKTRRELKKQRKIIVISLIAFLFIMVGGYAAFQTNLNITAKGNIVDRSRIIKSWTFDSNEDFHTDYYRENIVTATFLDTNQVASNATESWDVSVEKDKGVMAWVVPNSEDNTKYDLYIGANKGVVANENSSLLFYNLTGLKSIEFGENFDTSNVTNMARMFQDCISLIDLDLSQFNTSNVTDMSFMFAACSSLKTIDVSNFDTRNVITMNSMFDTWSTAEQRYVETSLTQIIFGENFKTNEVTNMGAMFYHQDKLEELNLCSFDTNNVINMVSIFRYTTNLKNIYVGPNWTTANADTTSMFSGSGVSSVTAGQC